MDELLRAVYSYQEHEFIPWWLFRPLADLSSDAMRVLWSYVYEKQTKTLLRYVHVVSITVLRIVENTTHGPVLCTVLNALYESVRDSVNNRVSSDDDVRIIRHTQRYILAVVRYMARHTASWVQTFMHRGIRYATLLGCHLPLDIARTECYEKMCKYVNTNTSTMGIRALVELNYRLSVCIRLFPAYTRHVDGVELQKMLVTFNLLMFAYGHMQAWADVVTI